MPTHCYVRRGGVGTPIRPDRSRRRFPTPPPLQLGFCRRALRTLHAGERGASSCRARAQVCPGLRHTQPRGLDALRAPSPPSTLKACKPTRLSTLHASEPTRVCLCSMRPNLRVSVSLCLWAPYAKIQVLLDHPAQLRGTQPSPEQKPGWDQNPRQRSA